MKRWRNSALARLTLLFFVVSLLFNPAYAQPIFANTNSELPAHADRIPITYIQASELSQLIEDMRHRGFTVRVATLAQLEQLTQADDTRQVPAKPSKQQPGEKTSQGCDDTSASDKAECAQGKTHSGLPDQSPGNVPEPFPVPGPDGSPAPPPQPSTTVQPVIGVHGDIGIGGHGNNSDVAKVFFLLAGVVVVAAFIVYAGKTVSEFVTNDNAKLWWEVIFNSSFMDTDARHHGRFYGAKLATGLVSRELFQLALVGEVGNADLDLIINENKDPQLLKYSAPYWMLGGAVRMHLTDKLVNASYLYLELMGGTTNDSSTDIIGAARLGASFGVNDSLRLGASLGAQYLGLNEDKGFTNNGNDYWFTLGLEVGVRF